ncbi:MULTISPECIES: hypothetical protein [Bacillus cereus group]|uniref:Uncharacterized protein n=1 Tax=Bacillus cereus TaxID=1396 RepID=A0A2C0EWC1_BACCE|nr:hypothetical protein [Bacillus cereus]PDY80572.1 hypothetical protein CON06_21595 [Bacillus cereus]PFA11574.1 hypothetical protein CN382_19055 [Bacillus cereus]PFM32428.1 hypothetical protein COJ43_27435 [Bacillus cereus]PGL57177.1 hypothetical protein CN927_25430 [Bacillus cereus]PGQ10634.1 hypothetical protein COA08_10825 [Bacillus cereus]
MKWEREDIIFETIREAEVWADSIANEMYGRVFGGYETPDYKIAYALAFFLAQNQGFTVCTGVICEEDRMIYRVWIANE